MFLNPSNPGVKIDYVGEYINPIINLKYVVAFYPSIAEYKTKEEKPNIIFILKDGQLEWVYNTEKNRDADFMRLVSHIGKLND